MRFMLNNHQRDPKHKLRQLIVAIALVVLGAGCANGSDVAEPVESATVPSAQVDEDATSTPIAEPTRAPAPTSTPEPLVDEAEEEANDQDEEPTVETSDQDDAEGLAQEDPGSQDAISSPFDWSFLGAQENLPLAVIDDPAPEDTFGEIGGAGIVAPASTLVASQAFIASLTAEQVDARFNNSSFPCGLVSADFTVTCPESAIHIDDLEFIVVGVEFEGPIASGDGDHNYALVFDDDGDASDNFSSEQFPGDWLTNSEFWYTLHIAADGTRTMWADGFVDQVPGVPRLSAALVIERGNHLYWVIPRSEVPGAMLVYRATGFTELGAPGDEFDATTSGGDFTGSSVLDPLIPIDLTLISLDNDATVPPDIDGSQERLEIPQDRALYVIRTLLDDFVDRTNQALGLGNPEATIDAILHPQQRFSPNAEACRQILRDTIVQANSVELPDTPAGVTPGVPLASYQPNGALNYPTGSVAWQPFLLMGPRGRLFLLIPQCL